MFSKVITCDDHYYNFCILYLSRKKISVVSLKAAMKENINNLAGILKQNNLLPQTLPRLTQFCALNSMRVAWTKSNKRIFFNLRH